MSSVAETSGHTGYLSQYLSEFAGLDREAQVEHIGKSTTDTIIELFKEAVHEESSGESEQLKEVKIVVLTKIKELTYKQLMCTKQEDKVRSIGQIAFSQMQHLENSFAKDLLVDILRGTINETNVYEMVRYGMDHKSNRIIFKCIEVITRGTGTSLFNCQLGGLHWQIGFTDTPCIETISTRLSKLKAFVGPDYLHLDIKLNGSKMLKRYLSFVTENSEIVKSLTFSNITSGKKIQSLLKNCNNIEDLSISSCSIVSGLEDLHLLTKLKILVIQDCILFQKLPDLRTLTNLQIINLSGYSPFEHLPDITGLTKLRRISIFDCTSLRTLPDLSTLINLTEIKIDGCFKIDQQERIRAFLDLFVKNPSLSLRLIKGFGLNNWPGLEQSMANVDIDLYLSHCNELPQFDKAFRIELFNQLINNRPEKAIESIYSFSKEGILPIKNQSAFIAAFENYDLNRNPQLALRIAVDISDCVIAEKAIAAGADVNTGPLGSSPLLKACKRRDARMANLLLHHGAEAKFLGGTHEHETPLSEARLHSDVMVDCLPLLTEKDEGFTDEVMAIKHLAHKFKISGESIVAGRKFHREGFRPRYLIDDYVRKSRSFCEELKRDFIESGGNIISSFRRLSNIDLLFSLRNPLVKEKLVNVINMTFSAIEHALDYEGIDINADGGKIKAQFLRELSEGKPVVFYGVTNAKGTWKTGGDNLHSWGLVIIKDPVSEMYLIHRCNRGYGVSESGILIGLFDELEMLNIIEKYQHLSNWKVASKTDADMFYLTLDKDIKDHGGRYLPQRKQTVGNCCYSSLQSIELALLTILLEPIFGPSLAPETARSIKQARSRQTKLKDLQAYLESHLREESRYPVDKDLIFSISKKNTKYAKLIGQYEKQILQDVNEGLPASSSGT